MGSQTWMQPCSRGWGCTYQDTEPVPLHCLQEGALPPGDGGLGGVSWIPIVSYQLLLFGGWRRQAGDRQSPSDCLSSALAVPAMVLFDLHLRLPKLGGGGDGDRSQWVSSTTPVS